MKLEEVTKELIEEYRKTKKLPENNFLYTYKNEKIELFDAILKQFNPYGDFNDLYIKKDYLDNLTANGYVKSITKDGYKYCVSTHDGNIIFYDAHNLFVDKQYPYDIQPGYCYANALYDCKHITETRPWQEAKINVGWIELPYEGDSPIIHAVCSFKAYDSMRYVIDYNLNLVMEEQMYKKFLNFQEINAYGDIMQILNLHELIKDNKNFNLSNHKLNYILMATKDYSNYVYEVYNNERKDDFMFVDRYNFKRYLRKAKHKRNVEEAENNFGRTI
ncbi:MAG: hypothetical protein MJ149_00930 [Clostridia bacterium]|nr:hypothetical protein [Clostridia bacterium]